MDSDKQFLLVILAIISVLSLVIILPVLEWVLMSVILAYVLYPVHIRVREYIGPMPSAIAVLGLAVVSIIVPITYILWVVIRDLQDVAAGETSLEVGEVEARIFELTGAEVDLIELSRDAASTFVDVLFGDVTAIISTALRFLVGIALVLFLVFYLLLEGEDFVAWVEDLSPLPIEDTKKLFMMVNKTMWGSVMGHSFAAVVQALVAGLGLWVAGIESVIFWTVVMAIFAFLPLIGAFIVVAPASIYLVIVGDTASGVFLFLYGLVVVSLVDNYVRAFVIDREAHLNPAVILVGVFGGIYTFGFVGLFVGPITIGVLAATLETIKSKQAGHDLEEIREADGMGIGNAITRASSDPDESQGTD